jgi:hypothetical protein
MYPIAAVVLNLPPEIRYKKENMILLGLWAGKKKDDTFSIYLDTFVKRMNKYCHESNDLGKLI